MTTPSERPAGATSCIPCSGTGRDNLQPNGDSEPCGSCNGRGWIGGVVLDPNHLMSLHRDVVDNVTRAMKRYLLAYPPDVTVRKIKVDALMVVYNRQGLADILDLGLELVMRARQLPLGDETQDIGFAIQRELAMVAFRTERRVLAETLINRVAVPPEINTEQQWDALPVVRMPLAEFEALPTYSTSLPTGTTVGKRWKGLRPGGWVLGEYIEIGRADRVGIRWSRIQVETSP